MLGPVKTAAICTWKSGWMVTQQQGRFFPWNSTLNICLPRCGGALLIDMLSVQSMGPASMSKQRDQMTFELWESHKGFLWNAYSLEDQSPFHKWLTIPYCWRWSLNPLKAICLQKRGRHILHTKYCRRTVAGYRPGTVERRVVAVLRIECRFILGDLWIWGPWIEGVRKKIIYESCCGYWLLPQVCIAFVGFCPLPCKCCLHLQKKSRDINVFGPTVQLGRIWRF